MTANDQQPRRNEGERLQGIWLALARILLAAIPLFGIVYAFSIPSYLGYAMWSQQAALIVLGFGLAATFMVKDVRGGVVGKGRPPALDLLFAALGLVFSLVTAFRYEYLVSVGYLGMGAEYYVNAGMAVVMLLLTLEALRRLTGWAMVILVALCLVYALLADKMPGGLQGQRPQLDFLLGYLFLDAAGLPGVALSVVVSTVIAYVLLGNALFRLGGGQMFMDLALASMGRYRGGPAKAAVLASSMFGSISGSAVANVATTGIVTIPLMKGTGYRPAQAGAIEAVASTGGQLLPPIMGAAAFIMAEFLGIPYSEVALAALLPALLFYAALLMQVHLHAARHDLRPLTREERPRATVSLRKYWPFLGAIALLVYLLFFRRWQPEQAAFAALFAVMVAAAYVREKSIGPRALFALLHATGRSLLDIIAITAAAGIVLGVLSLTGLSFSLGLEIATAAGSNTFMLLVITALAAIVFGMGMPTTAVYVLMATLIAPALVAAGFEPLAAHMFVLYYGALSMITPPVCLASFTAASLAGAPFMRTGLDSVRFGLVGFIVPFMFVLAPTLLMQGDSWVDYGRAFVTGIVGSLLLAAAVEGFLFSLLGWSMRALMALAGLMLLIPDTGATRLLPHVQTDLIGVVLAILAVGSAWMKSRSAKAPLLKAAPTRPPQ